jgi:hypothetical protein
LILLEESQVLLVLILYAQLIPFLSVSGLAMMVNFWLGPFADFQFQLPSVGPLLVPAFLNHPGIYKTGQKHWQGENCLPI